MRGTLRNSTLLGALHIPPLLKISHRLCIRYGGPLVAVQGVGYLNELIGCLTNSPAHHDLRTSKTLLSFPETFPLNRKMYVDFSQDNLMAPSLLPWTCSSNSTDLSMPRRLPKIGHGSSPRWYLFPARRRLRGYLVHLARNSLPL